MKTIDDKFWQQLTPSERETIAYIEKHPAEIAGMNIQALADAVFVSTTAIVRLCKKLELSGFNELKYGIRQSMEQNRSKDDTSLDFTGLLSGSLSSLRQMREDIDPSAFERVIRLLCGEGKLYLFARGLTFMPMNYMYHMLLSVDRDCILYIDPPLIYHAALEMEEGDMAIIASSGGSTKEVLKAAQMVKDSKACLTVLSSSEKTPLKDIADVFFLCPSPMRRFDDLDINSRMPIVFMIELILDGYFSRLNLNPPSDPKVYVDLKNW